MHATQPNACMRKAISTWLWLWLWLWLAVGSGRVAKGTANDLGCLRIRLGFGRQLSRPRGVPIRDHQNLKYQQVHSDKPISMV